MWAGDIPGADSEGATLTPWSQRNCDLVSMEATRMLANVLDGQQLQELAHRRCRRQAIARVGLSKPRRRIWHN